MSEFRHNALQLVEDLGVFQATLLRLDSPHSHEASDDYCSALPISVRPTDGLLFLRLRISGGRLI